MQQPHMKKDVGKKDVMEFNIRKKIFIYLVGFCAFLLFVLAIFQVVLLEPFYKYIKVQDIKNSADKIALNIDKSNIEDTMKNVAANYEVCIEMITPKGNMVYQLDALNDCLIHKMPVYEKLNFYINAIENGGEWMEYYNMDAFTPIESSKPLFGGGSTVSIIYSRIITSSNGDKTLLLLNSVVTPVSATVRTLRSQLTTIMVGMIITAGILAFIIAKKVADPIISINRSAKVLATGDYSVNFEGSGYTEISELSDTLNYAASELSKVDSLRRELIANISHDLRTPLTLISGYAEVMRDIPCENTEENLQVIIDETKRLASLVNDVLNISKYQSGTQTANMTKFDLTQSIKKQVDRLDELVRNDGYNIEFIFEQNINVCADELLLSQALYNLITNALTYCGEDKLVQVYQLVNNDRVTIQVIDKGDGIAEENLGQIWDKYYKINKTHKRPVTGTGLGLTIVKSVIDLHNGTVGVNSEIDKGSTFWFEIPLDASK